MMPVGVSDSWPILIAICSGAIEPAHIGVGRLAGAIHPPNRLSLSFPRLWVTWPILRADSCGVLNNQTSKSKPRRRTFMNSLEWPESIGCVSRTRDRSCPCFFFLTIAILRLGVRQSGEPQMITSCARAEHAWEASGDGEVSFAQTDVVFVRNDRCETGP